MDENLQPVAQKLAKAARWLVGRGCDSEKLVWDWSIGSARRERFDGTTVPASFACINTAADSCGPSASVRAFVLPHFSRSMNRRSILRTSVAAAATSAGGARSYVPNTIAGDPAAAMLGRPYPAPLDAELRALLG